MSRLKQPSGRWISVLAAAVCLLFTDAAATGPEVQKSVLLIYDARNDMLGNIVVDRAIRKTLDDEFTFNLDIRSEFFEGGPSAKEDFPVLLSWLRRKYAGQSFDVVVPIGATALQFVRDYQNDLFKESQIVYWGRKPGFESCPKASAITGVVLPPMETQMRGTLGLISTLQPDLKNLIVVSGASAADRNWAGAVRTALSAFPDRIDVTYLAGLPLESMLKRLSDLPPKAAVLFLPLNEDGAGRRLLRTPVLSKAVEIANAPIYSTSVLYLDTGIMGGAFIDQEATAVDVAGLVAGLLRGGDIRDMPPMETRFVPTVNWKTLNRWQIDPKRVPREASVFYRDPSLWDTYRWHVVGVVSICFLETALIVALLVHRRRHRRAEKALSENRALLQSTIDALNARVALLDQNGTTIAVNRRWKAFAGVNGHPSAVNGSGYSYAEGSDAQNEERRLVSNGIRSLMSGGSEDFRCVYSFIHPGGTSWFQVRMTRFDVEGTPRLVVTHEDVTEIKRAHDTQQELTGLLMRAQDEERRRIARDLHDGTVQDMVAIKADLTGIEARARNLDPVATEMLNESLTLCNGVIKELRTLSYLLHPPFLDEMGLVPALRWFVRGFIQRSDVKIELMIMEDIGRLPVEIETALFRVVQESLTNIHRHSGSSTAVIWLTKEGNSIVLRVRDEGHGFSMPATPDDQTETLSPGVGILGMRQRLRQLGGRLEIESSPQGTCINASVSILEDANNAHFVS
ncbi:MAG TPA: histidine kinase [Terriglobia bacterium]|nr:histidine kinase [Terriglobia bacterium]